MRHSAFMRSGRRSANSRRRGVSSSKREPKNPVLSRNKDARRSWKGATTTRGVDDADQGVGASCDGVCPRLVCPGKMPASMIGGSRRRHACRRAKTLWRLAYSLTLQTRSIQGLYVSDRHVCGQTLSLGLKVDGAKARMHTHADGRDFGFSGRALAAGQIRFYFTQI